jgi:hypothetical protein
MLPRRIGIIPVVLVEKFRPDRRRQNTVQDRVLPDVAALSAMVNEPNVKASLMGVHPKLA